jgi:hypothetical protein
VSEDRKYTTIALDKESTYITLLDIQHSIEKEMKLKLSFSQVIDILCAESKWGEKK